MWKERAKKAASRLREPSTWAGLAVLANLAGVGVQVEAVGQAVMAVCAALAVVMPEKKG